MTDHSQKPSLRGKREILEDIWRARIELDILWEEFSKVELEEILKTLNKTL